MPFGGENGLYGERCTDLMPGPRVDSMGGDQPTHHRVGDDVDLGIDGLTDVSVIGSGGSSTVYRARQDVLDRTVAVKVIHATWSIETRERFDQERQVMGRLSGQAAIVPIFATGITARGEPYLLLPFYERGSLFRLMQDRGPLPWREATFIVEALAQALADCHREGIVHRDVKPGNVLLTDHLQPRLADFGITQPKGHATTGTEVAYTPSYSPPEAFSSGTTDPTVDVYGLGATLWALLAGRAPFTEVGEATDPAVIMERASTDSLDEPSLSTPAPVMQLLRRTMAKEPSKRPQDAAEFGAELRRAVRLGESGQRTTTTAGGRSETALTAVLVGVIVVGVAFIAIAAWVALS